MLAEVPDAESTRGTKLYDTQKRCRECAMGVINCMFEDDSIALLVHTEALKRRLRDSSVESTVYASMQFAKDPTISQPLGVTWITHFVSTHT